MRPRALSCCLLLALASVAGAADPPPADPVTVYRCVDARGQVTLGDVPCPEGSTGRTLEMQRPTDGAPLNRATPKTPPPPEPQVVIARAPPPVYECQTPDGERYTSDSDDGNPRWVPLWTLGYGGGWRPGERPDARRGATREAGSPWGRVGAPAPSPQPPATGNDRPDRPGRPPPGGGHGPGHGPRPGHGGFAGYGGGTWVRDTCRALPQREVCARLTDRRDAIRRRFFNAQERERDTLRIEERDIDARLAADCGTY